MIETDLRLTRDGAIVLAHDAYSPKGVSVERSTLSRLQEDFPQGDEGVLTLKQALDAFGGKVEFNLELKDSSQGKNGLLAEAVFREVSERGLLLNTLFSSFEITILSKVRAQSSSARIGVLQQQDGLRSLQQALDLQAESIHPRKQGIASSQIEIWHSEGLLVNVYTVDDPEEIEAMWRLGADGIFTNYPARALDLVRRFDALT